MRTRPCLPPAHYRHWPIMLWGPHTHIHCVIAESSKTLLNLGSTLPLPQTLPLTLTHKDIQTQEPMHFIQVPDMNIIKHNHLSAHIHTLKFFFIGIIDTETTQTFLPHGEYTLRQNQVVNNWCCQSATVLSEGTACKCNRRKVKTLTSNYLSPEATAVEVLLERSRIMN